MRHPRAPALADGQRKSEDHCTGAANITNLSGIENRNDSTLRLNFYIVGGTLNFTNSMSSGSQFYRAAWQP
jgi:hypothetical protein